MGTITKALNLLNYFSVTKPEIGLTEFKRMSGQDKATVYRHLSELEENGFLEQNPQTRNYRLGAAILRLANVREHTFPARKAVAPIVRAMSEELGELVHVSLLQGNIMSPLYHADVAIHGTRVYFDAAEMLPLHATSSGLAMLAFGPDNLLREVTEKPVRSFTDKTITDPDALHRHVEMARERGYSTSDEGFESDVFSFAVPIFDSDGRATGTLAVALPCARATEEMRDRIVTALKSGGVAVSRALGGAAPKEIERLWHDAA